MYEPIFRQTKEYYINVIRHKIRNHFIKYKHVIIIDFCALHWKGLLLKLIAEAIPVLESNQARRFRGYIAIDNIQFKVNRRKLFFSNYILEIRTGNPSLAVKILNDAQDQSFQVKKRFGRKRPMIIILNFHNPPPPVCLYLNFCISCISMKTQWWGERAREKEIEK